MAVTTNVTAESPNVSVDVTGGEYLLYMITVRGSQAVFDLTDTRTGKLLISDKTPPDAEDPLIFTRKWPLPEELNAVTAATNHTLGMHFAAAVEYHYQAAVFDSQDQSKETIIDIVYSSDSSGDSYFQSLNVNAS